MPKEAKENKSFLEKLISKDATKTEKKAEKSKKTSKSSTTAKKQGEKDKKSPTAKLQKTTTNKTAKSKKDTKSTVTKKVATSRTRKTKKETDHEDISKELSKSKYFKTASPEDFSVLEYYDLPYHYNQTVVKVLAQTPTTLFIYWDISDDDRENYKKQYGENFFEITKPVLIIYNDTMNYSFEIEINDFANCWYLNVNDSKCKYHIELGRRPLHSHITIPSVENNYVSISYSNEMEAPNDHILFDRNQKMIYFRNVKTNTERSIETASISFIQNMGKIYNVYDMYKELYKEEDSKEIYDLSNPSSKGNPSSNFKAY